MKDSDAIYDRLVAETAGQWFAHCGNLLVWDWNHDEPGCCHPALVAQSHQDGKPFPAAVRSRDSGFFPALLRDEWTRAGFPAAKTPVARPVPDALGRMAWLVDLRKASRKTRCILGLACMRELRLPAWDFELQGLVFPGASKTSVIHVGGYGHICEPSVGDLVEVLEAMTPDDPETASFTLVHSAQCYLSMLMTLEGCIVQVRKWDDVRGLIYCHFQACMGVTSTPDRTLQNGCPVADCNHLPWAIAMSLALAFHARPDRLPEVAGIFWQDVSGEFTD